jgi:hypothetical protein
LDQNRKRLRQLATDDSQIGCQFIESFSDHAALIEIVDDLFG